MIKTEKTIYDPQDKTDGKRILVMRLWPRGISKEKIDTWAKEVGTEPELIKKWKAGKISWKDFSHEYMKSLKGKEPFLKELAAEAKHHTITLLCSCKDENHCHRSLLKKAIEAFLP
jgi:uncharacterized protein YeaO (DUF488 family)